MKRGMTGIITLAFAVLVLIVFMSAGALAATLLTSCGNITSSGEYVLANDVSSTTGCFMISASNVTLDCAGHTITFLTQLPNFEQVRAIYAPAWTTNDNIEIKNCKIVNGSSSNLSYLITLYEGIEVIGHNITIRDSYISTPGTSVAIWDNSNTSLITNNTIHSDHGTAIYARGAKISYNNVEAITSIYYGSRGIVAEDGSIVFSNTIFASAYGSSRGIQVTGNSQIYNNTITVVNGTGIIGGVGGTGSAGNSYVDIYDNFIYVTGAFPDGIYVQNSKNFTISSNQIFVTVLSGYTWNDAGILLYDSYNANYLFGGHELFNNTITAVCADECDLTAIRVSTSVAKSNNYLIYNNLFKAYGYANLSAVSSNSLNNRWNIEPIPGTNVVGGSYISGNAWLKSDNTGYSQECLDGNLDGLCDYSYTISGTNVDNNPIRINPFIGFQNELPIEGSIDYKITIAGTGTQQIYVCIDKCGEGGTPICDPVTDNVWPYVNSVTTEGVNCVRHQAIDRVGNLEDVKVNMIKIDKSNPIVTLEDLPEYDNDGFVNVVWDSVDAVSGIAEMEIYRNGLLIYTSENAIGNYVDDLSAPEYEGQTFSYYAVARDFAGRTANSNTVTTTISKISQPTTPTIIPLPVFTNALNVVVSWFRSIDLQGVNLYNLFIDNFITPFTSVSEPDPYGTNEYDTRSYSDTNVADGQTITYAVSATDNYGTESNQSERTSTTIDVSAPVTTKTIAPL
ncbi:MAG: right-handed parallel beta-helix repeat-containing protein, partial [Candidatus Pacearchaeota archaeon]